MTDLRKAAEMALEALLNYPLTEGRAIQALRQALAQPDETETLKRCLFQMQEAAKALAQPEQKPVKCICGYAIGHPLVSKCICTLRKPWTSLTVDEILDCYKDNLDRTMFVYIVQTIEAKLKEKNT